MPNESTSPRPAGLALFTFLLAATALVAHARNGPDTAQRSDEVRPAGIEVAFVLDTTGSMSGLLEGAKQKIWSLASQLADNGGQLPVRMALVGYRDRGDAYVTRVHPLSDDIDAVYGHLQAFQAGGGGDGPESVNQALHEAINDLDWSQGAGVYRVVFLVGDAPPHMDYPSDVSWERTARIAAQRDIRINTVQCGAAAETAVVWRGIAQAGLGEFAQIAQDGAMVAMESPMDAELATLNRTLAETVVGWGRAEEQRELADKRQRMVRAPAPSAAARLSYLDKSGGRVNSGRSDLVDAWTAGEVEVAALPAESLPESLRALDEDELTQFLESKKEQRKDAMRRVSELVEKRDAWVQQEFERRERSGAESGFDDEVLGVVRRQAAEKGIRYE